MKAQRPKARAPRLANFRGISSPAPSAAFAPRLCGRGPLASLAQPIIRHETYSGASPFRSCFGIARPCLSWPRISPAIVQGAGLHGVRRRRVWHLCGHIPALASKHSIPQSPPPSHGLHGKPLPSSGWPALFTASSNTVNPIRWPVSRGLHSL